MNTPLLFEPLGAQHERQKFDCGYENLNLYFQRYARQNAKRDYGVTRVGFRAEEPTQVVAFYTLANSKIAPERFPAELKKPPLDAPTILLARLGVDLRFQGQGLGGECLNDIFRRVVMMSQNVGIAALEVEAIDDAAARFYARFGFLPLQDSPHHLFLFTPRIRLYLAAQTAP